MVVLYNRRGDSVCFSTLGWQELLTCATRYGWKPSGTTAPAETWNIDYPPSERTPWDGNYSIPAGQLVGSKDATELAEAVERALVSEADWQTDGATLRRFTIFCQQRGFLVSATRFVPGAGATPRVIAFPKPPARTPLHLAS